MSLHLRGFHCSLGLKNKNNNNKKPKVTEIQKRRGGKVEGGGGTESMWARENLPHLKTSPRQRTTENLALVQSV